MNKVVFDASRSLVQKIREDLTVLERLMEQIGAASAPRRRRRRKGKRSRKAS